MCHPTPFGTSTSPFNRCTLCVTKIVCPNMVPRVVFSASDGCLQVSFLLLQGDCVCEVFQHDLIHPAMPPTVVSNPNKMQCVYDEVCMPLCSLVQISSQVIEVPVYGANHWRHWHTARPVIPPCFRYIPPPWVRAWSQEILDNFLCTQSPTYASHDSEFVIVKEVDRVVALIHVRL